MTNRLPQAAALAFAVPTVWRMLDSTPEWLGDWNETGSLLGPLSLLGGMLAALVLAVDARRNGRPLQDIRRGAPHPMLARLREAVTSIAWPFGTAVLVSGALYAATAVQNPHPSIASPWPIVTTQLFILIQLEIGRWLGLRLHPALALPLTALLTFVLPAAAGSAEPSLPAAFTTSTSTSLALNLAPDPVFFRHQCLLFAAVAIGLAIESTRTSFGRWDRAVAAASVLAVAASAAVLGTGPIERVDTIHDFPGQACAQGSEAEVCVFPDHARLLPELVHGTELVAAAVPEGNRPSRYVEDGLLAESGDARIDTLNVRIDPAAATLEAASSWRVCGPDKASERFSWLAQRTGLDPTQKDAIPDIMAPSQKDQLRWWASGMSATC